MGLMKCFQEVKAMALKKKKLAIGIDVLMKDNIQSARQVLAVQDQLNCLFKKQNLLK
jgi:hypothetical protein